MVVTNRAIAVRINEYAAGGPRQSVSAAPKVHCHYLCPKGIDFGDKALDGNFDLAVIVASTRATRGNR